MTFSLLARCPHTGQIGAAVTTSSIAVGARVAFVAAGVGAVLTQHRTDPRLGPRGLALLGDGCTAAETRDALVASTPLIAWRQLAVLDAAGRAAAFTGARNGPACGEAHGAGVVAIGNILANDAVPAAMVSAFEASTGMLAARLVDALAAGLTAGGEPRPVRSAALLVAGTHSFPLIDLRIDWSDTPIADLHALWARYAPEIDAYVARAVDPDSALAAA